MNKVTYVGLTIFGQQISTPQNSIYLDPNKGVRGDKHYSETVALDARLLECLGPYGGVKGATTLSNWRQVSVVSEQELIVIQANLGLNAPIPSGLLAENIVVSFPIGDFSKIPSGSLLVFTNGGKMSCVLWVMAENVPCAVPGKNLAEHYQQPDLVSLFVPAARGLRGLVVMVFCPGVIKKGYEMHVEQPRFS